ncbi:MAG: sugar phosphate isomerase/epimerase family protein [Bryobacteraceae bacterium]|jgi:sugar phosphate isomerase/epimerase
MNRRHFVQVAAVLPVWAADAKPMRLGLIVSAGRDPENAIRTVQELGLPTCQVAVGSFEPELAGRLRGALDRYGVEATSVVAGGPGPEGYDFYQGPLTIGLVPRATREARIARVRQTSDFAKKCGIPAVQTHCGFIPENPNDPVYKEAVDAVRQVAAYCRKNGQSFRCETGQETPVTLLRTIRDVGLDNVGVNFDPANLIMYGKADPVEALDLLGPLVLGVHAKDGLYPVDPKNLGREVPIGQGKVDFPRFIWRLKGLGYRGPLTIEREVSGPKQIKDVRAAKAYLEKLVG